MKQKKNPSKVTLILSEIEEQNLNVLLNKYGGKAPAFFHMLLKDAYEKEFGGYKMKTLKVKPIEEALTDEQYCEMLGGRVGKNSDGNPVCIKGAWSVPLDQRVMMKNRFKE